jgi:GT2 family glycosyltransferase
MAKGVLQTIISGRTGLAHSAVLARPRPRDACAEGAGGSHARAEPDARASRRVASDTPRVSVAIATRQRASLLPRLLSALETQTMPVDEFEVVIADDGSTDDTPEILRRSLAETPLNLRVERRDRRGGPAVARNTAWRAARGPIIAWTDDDCIPSPQWLDAGVRAMGTGRAIVIGKTLPNPDQQHRRGPFSHTMSATRWELARYLSTCNIFYRRDDLEAVGGFDERFTTGEDTDVGMRISKDGAEIVFCSDALVHHDVTVSRFRSALRSAGRWTDLPLVARKHPEARRLLYEGLFWRGAHKKALLGALGIVAGVVLAFFAPVAFVVLPLLLVVPWVRHRIRIDPLCEGPCRWAVLPAAFVIDLLETLTLVRGSIRHRSLLL